MTYAAPFMRIKYIHINNNSWSSDVQSVGWTEQTLKDHPYHPPTIQMNKNVDYNVAANYLNTNPSSKARKERSPGAQTEDKTQTRVLIKAKDKHLTGCWD